MNRMSRCSRRYASGPKPSDSGTTIKGAIRSVVKAEHERLLKRAPERLNGLHAGFSNVVEIAMRLGLSFQYLRADRLIRARLPRLDHVQLLLSPLLSLRPRSMSRVVHRPRRLVCEPVCAVFGYFYFVF